MDNHVVIDEEKLRTCVYYTAKSARMHMIKGECQTVQILTHFPLITGLE